MTALSRDDNNVPVGWKYRHIVGQETVLVKSGSGVLGKIVFNGPIANATVAVYDGLSASGDVIALITLPASIKSDVAEVFYDVVFNTGLTVVTAIADEDITVTYI